MGEIIKEMYHILYELKCICFDLTGVMVVFLSGWSESDALVGKNEMYMTCVGVRMGTYNY